MSKYIPGNQKHLTLEDRKYIEKSLNAGCSFKDIARYLCKDPTTISKEIRLHTHQNCSSASIRVLKLLVITRIIRSYLKDG